MIKINKVFKNAFSLMNDTDEHVFITGNAGTGKSTLLRYFRKKTNKNVVVLAPTGVAALNVKGQTIHSFFGFKPNVSPSTVKRLPKERQDIFQTVETVVLDEVSMLRADLLDCIDKALRLNRNQPQTPFGGVQMIFIGDLFQLPPILTDQERFMFDQLYQSPYFFSAYVFKDINIQYVELKKIYRQKDKTFIDLLNRVRNNRVSEKDVTVWNSRHDSSAKHADSTKYIHLTTTNQIADQRNELALKQLPGEEIKFKGSFNGNFDGQRTPAPSSLNLKRNARVMFVNNDLMKRWVNGSLGTVVDFIPSNNHEPTVIKVKLEDGKTVSVTPNKWELFTYVPDGLGGVGMEITGEYTQYPLTLAWAVTVHKSQGKTFNRVLVDTGWGMFAHGQMYVALSRCTSLKGIILRKPFRKKDVILDETVAHFISNQKND